MPRCHLYFDLNPQMNTSPDGPYSMQQAPMPHMQRDQNIYDAIGQDSTDYTVRFYTWPQTTLTLGRFQRLDTALEGRLQQQGIPWVRRPTGGQAILHQGDLTFSVVGPLNPERQHQLLDTYRLIAKGLQQGLKHWQIEAETVIQAPENAHKNAACYASSSQADLQYKGQKLIGCAQVRRRRAFLQQGVIYRQAPHHLHKALFHESIPVLSLNELCRQVPSLQELAQHLGTALQEVLTQEAC